MPQLHLILITHTPRHLERCLLACAHQSRSPESVVLSCDVVNDEIARIAHVAAPWFARSGTPLTLVQRPHTGKSRASQVRNNAVRALLGGSRPPESNARLVFFDGDICPAHNALHLHESLGGSDRLVCPYRVNLTERQTQSFSDDAVRACQPPVSISPEQTRELESRHTRLRRRLFMRSIGLGKAHKPMLLGAHFSVPLKAYLQVNGCDEMYQDYGQEDDDLTRRLYHAGWKTVVAARQIIAYHLYHPTRAPGDWHNAPGVARFNARPPLPTRAEHGVENPLDQPEVTVQTFVPAGT